MNFSPVKCRPRVLKDVAHYLLWCLVGATSGSQWCPASKERWYTQLQPKLDDSERRCWPSLEVSDVSTNKLRIVRIRQWYICKKEGEKRGLDAKIAVQIARGSSNWWEWNGALIWKKLWTRKFNYNSEKPDSVNYQSNECLRCGTVLTWSCLSPIQLVQGCFYSFGQIAL